MSLIDEFKNSCKSIYGKVTTSKKCPDQYVMYIDLDYDKPIIDILCSNKKPRKPQYISEIATQSCGTIALVLESPHTEEFYSNGNPIGPAMGKTGENISKYLLHILKNKNIKGKYKVILVEAVSFQCSNGESPINSQKRDKVFQDIWKNGGEKDFIQRLNTYNPEIVINACTGGIGKINSGKTLNSLVHNTLKKESYKKYFYTAHPCSIWFFIIGLKK